MSTYMVKYTVAEGTFTEEVLAGSPYDALNALNVCAADVVEITKNGAPVQLRVFEPGFWGVTNG